MVPKNCFILNLRVIHPGLGSHMDDICGKDWVPGGGDHGDPGNSASLLLTTICLFLNSLTPRCHICYVYDIFTLKSDLARAISQLKETTELSIKLVVFGHMHKALASGNGLRKMMVVGDDNTVYLNGAIVPRVKTISKEQAVAAGTLRAFTIADISEGSLEKITETWVSVVGDEVRVEDELVLFGL